MTNASRVCAECGATVFADAPQGVCSVCLFRTGLASLDNKDDQAFEPTVARMSKDFGDYELLEEIGRGGQGVVYRARQKSLNRIVALKVIGLAHWATEAHVKRFRLEAEAAASLNHPCIVPIYEVGERDGACYFSMGLVEGGQLDAVAKREPIPIRRAAELIAKLARTVSYAHEHGILHRDIKPGNILLDAKGEPHLTDFGLARLVETESTVTRTMEVLGTPSYMAPEQAVGNNAGVTRATDIYGLGAVLYQLLTGHPPFAGGTTFETVRLVLDTEPRQPRLLNPKVDRDLATICLKCLDKDPQRRYSSALALAEDLERWLKHEPIRGRRTGIFTGGRKWMRRNRKLVATGAACLLVGAAVIWLFRGELFRASQFNPPEKSIAVLPFLDLSQSKDQEYFCDGISEEILHALAKVDGLRVTGRTSSFSFKGTSVNARKVGEKLNVENVLEGSLRREGNRIRLTAQLINARDGFHLWSETYERELKDVFAVQDEITRSIVDALKIKLAVAPPAHARQNTEAYDLYLQGLYFSNKSDEEELRKSLDLFQRSLEKDPNSARAWIGIAKAWIWLADAYVKPLEAYSKVKEAASKALALDERNAEAHSYLGETKRILDRNLSGEDEELKRALEIDPNAVDAHLFMSFLKSAQGELEEAVQEIEEAERLDPLSPPVCFVAVLWYRSADRIEDAINAGQRSVQLDPNYVYFDPPLADAYREKGDFNQAVALYEKAQAATHFPSPGLGITYAKMGRREDCRHVVDQLIEKSRQQYVAADSIAAVYVALGEKDEALRWLERAFEEHSGSFYSYLFRPEFRPLRSDPRFADLLRRTGIDPIKALARQNKK